MAKVGSGWKPSSNPQPPPRCADRSLFERIFRRGGHFWLALDFVSMYGTRERRCSYCGQQQIKPRWFRSWITLD